MMENEYSFLFKKSELVPTIVQDSKSGEVLMLAYMNEESFSVSLRDKKCTFFSRSRNKLWQKGETSGNFMLIEKIKYDCDCDTLLILVTPIGPACHTGNNSCFFREYIDGGDNDKTVM